MIRRGVVYLADRPRLLRAMIALATLVTLGLTQMPSADLPQGSIWSYDRLGHVVLFGGWTLLLGFSFVVARRHDPWPLSVVLAAGVGFGIGVEVLQELLPFGRTADLYDAVADTIGCGLAVTVLRLLDNVRRGHGRLYSRPTPARDAP